MGEKTGCIEVLYGEVYSGNIFMRKSGLLSAGKVMPSHVHNFDHTTIVFSGAVRVRRGEEEVVVRAPGHLLIRAGVEHEITSLEDGTVYWCVYSHRTPQGEVSQEVTGWEAAYT